MPNRYRLLLILFTFLLLAACGQPTADETETPTAVANPAITLEPPILATPLSREEMLQAIPALAEREAQFAAVLASEQPVITLSDDEIPEPQKQLAQELALQSPGFQENYFHPETGAPLRNEIMNVRPLLPADVTEKTQACRQTTCYR
ncbi:MAG: hypothetical protein GY803_27250, partial [Chloroflexi bacterium]|nr:hypothetical protein [Chloroflexota bacterium]